MSLTNNQGQVISWSSAGKMGFRGSKKTPYAAETAAKDCAQKAYEADLRKVYVKGQLEEVYNENSAQNGIVVTEIVDVTPIPHNGCRPPKRRRV